MPDPAGLAFQESIRELRRICCVKEVLPKSCTVSVSLLEVTPMPASVYVCEGTLSGSKVRIRRAGVYPKRVPRKVTKVCPRLLTLTSLLGY